MCGGSMTLRTARRGHNAGNSFWGCSDYPNCRGIRATEEDQEPVEGPARPFDLTYGSTTENPVTWSDRVGRQGWSVKYRKYYGDPFLSDLDIFRTWAQGGPHGEHPKFSTNPIFAIQPYLFERHSHDLILWGEERLFLFSTAIFFTVLVDQVCYTHFNHSYPHFQHLTRYPKLRGPCPGGCNNRHPRDIFWMVNYYVFKDDWPGGRYLKDHRPLDPLDHHRDLLVRSLVGSATSLMKGEVFEFFQNHDIRIDPEEFWTHCIQHVPSVGNRF